MWISAFLIDLKGKNVMTGYRIHFIRHAITLANEEGRYIGITESPISERGRRELAEKTEKFVYPEVDKVYVSPLKRCIATASFIYPQGYARVVPEFREMNFGEFEGKKAADLMGRPDYKQFLRGGLDNPAPGGEPMRKVVERCYEGVHDEKRLQKRRRSHPRRNHHEYFKLLRSSQVLTQRLCLRLRRGLFGTRHCADVAAVKCL